MVRDSRFRKKKEFCVFNLHYSYYLLTSTINHVFDDSWFWEISWIPDFERFLELKPENGESWLIVCWVSSQNCLYENVCNNFNIICQNCSNRFTDTRSRLASYFNYFIIDFLGIIYYFWTLKLMNWISSCKVKFHWGFLSYYQIYEYLDFQWVPMLTLIIFYDYLYFFFYILCLIFIFILANFLLKYFRLCSIFFSTKIRSLL